LDIPDVEEPMRLVQQLGALARGVLALGLPEEAASAIARRAALDSMPEARRAVLQVLSSQGVVSTSACARQAGLDRKVARMALEDLAAVGVVNRDDSLDDSDEPDFTTVKWWLSGDGGDIIARIVKGSSPWDEMWVYTSTSPP
jgi:hypothetical protein